MVNENTRKSSMLTKVHVKTMKASLRKKIVILLIAFSLSLSMISAFEVNNLASASDGGFAVKAAGVFYPTLAGYNGLTTSQCLSILRGLGINAMRVYGFSAEVNLLDNANWATTLNNFLTTCSNAGIKVYFMDMGGAYGDGFGIADQLEASPIPVPALCCSKYQSGWQLDIYGKYWTPATASNVQPIIDALAGKTQNSYTAGALVYGNSLGHNFLTDPRIIGFEIGNENTVGDYANGVVTLNSVGTWEISLMDYMRSKGATNIIADCPVLTNYGAAVWDQNFAHTASVFYGHANYIETHEYYDTTLIENYISSGNWYGFQSYVANDLTAQMRYANNAGFDNNHVILGEFGIWHGYSSWTPNYCSYTFTDQNVIDYYSHYFQALNSILPSYRWVSFWSSFDIASGGWGMISASSGTLFSGCNVIREYYEATYTSPVSNPTPSPTPAPTPSPTPAPTGGSKNTFGITTVGSLSTTFYTGMPRATQYTATSSGTITDIMLYLTGSGHAQTAIYSDNGNVPGALLAKSSSDTIYSNGWHDFTGFNVAITAGTPYWLACESDSGNLLWYYNNGGANYYQGTGYSYGTFPSPYIKGGSGNYNPSIYAIYTTASGSYPTPTPSPRAPTPSPTPAPTPSPTPAPTGGSKNTFGITTVGSLSTTFYTGMPRATQFTATSSGTITDIMLYLTGSGHAQTAIYSDNGNVPGALLAKSSSDTIYSNGWHDFTGFNVAITAGTPYWLACESDSGNLLWYYNNGGANYYQGTGYSYGTFPSPYIKGGSGNYNPSIYAIYTTT